MDALYYRYIILHLFMVFIFLIFGKKMSASKTNATYWKSAIIPILTFAIVSGLRFGRDVDYNVYYEVFHDKSSFDELEFFFRILLEFFHFIDLPYWSFVLFCSVLLISSFILLLSHYRDASKYALILFLGIMGIENLIRWYLAASIMFVGLHFLLINKKVYAVVLALISIGVHMGIAFSITVIFAAFYWLKNKTLKPIYVVLAYVLTSILADTQPLIYLAGILNRISFLSSLSSKSEVYMNNLVDIASGGMKTGIYVTSVTAIIRTIIAYSLPILFGSSTMRNTDKYKWLYNFACITLILSPIFFKVEIFNRIISVQMFFVVISVSLMLNELQKNKYKYMISMFFYMISVFFLYYPIIKPYFDRIYYYQLMYIWDAGTLEYLPINLFIK